MLLTLITQSLIDGIWFKAVNDKVKEPYLDEVFHVRQAQHYCQSHLDVWDPKITTPPGLYILSYILSPFLGCSLASLRSLSLICLPVLLAVIAWTYSQRNDDRQSVVINQHSALNITLFPPLFFFSALYYTDVTSTLSVLVFYYYSLHSNKCGPRWWHPFVLVLLGSISLMFRQTNIFWVAVFPAGLVLVDELDRGHDVVKDSMYRRVEGFGDSFVSVARTAWKMDVVCEPTVRDAWIEDYIKTIISVLVCTAKVFTKPTRLTNLLYALSPYLALIALFAGFIYWNGSVVLGDKSNHIVTLHLPQMLYIWPYFTFFSWPIIYPYLLVIPFAVILKLASFASLETMLIFKRRGLVPRTWLAVALVLLACLVVRFNTIVHPFTLADNRHYTFYAFRLLLRKSWVKYAVTPLYVAMGWACLQALGARPFEDSRRSQRAVGKDEKLTKQRQNDQRGELSLPNGSNSARTSFVLVWLATTALQLVTAPLVEPRYLILPWIFWRIHVPLQQYRPAQGSKRSSFDHRLWLETAWFLVVNAVTGYIFLRWEFFWPQEPGKVQRFMW